jgi:hypothetical protein
MASVTVGPDDRFRAPPYVHTRAFDGETVVVDLNSGDYYGLNELGASFWQEASAGKSAREVAQALQGRFQVEPERLLADLLALASELVERKLLERV